MRSHPRGLIVLAAFAAIALYGCAPQQEAPPAAPFEEVQHESPIAPIDEFTTEVDVQLALLDALGVEGLRVETDVVGDRVVLTGTVHEAASREQADEVVMQVSGVDEVDNRIAVAPSEDSAADDTTTGALQQELVDTTLELRIELALYGAIGMEAQRLTVEVADGTASVGGVVDSDEDKQAALAAAEGIGDVEEVIDLIEVAQPVITEEEA